MKVLNMSNNETNSADTPKVYIPDYIGASLAASKVVDGTKSNGVTLSTYRPPELVPLPEDADYKSIVEAFRRDESLVRELAIHSISVAEDTANLLAKKYENHPKLLSRANVLLGAYTVITDLKDNANLPVDAPAEPLPDNVTAINTHAA